MTMEELLKQNSSSQPISLQRGQGVEGTVISVSDKEVLLDLGAKAEAVLNKKEAGIDVKEGDKLQVYVVELESESGQIIVSTNKNIKLDTGRSPRDRDGKRKPSDRDNVWNKFIQLKDQKTQLSGTVTEVNKGGLIIEVDGIRGFLPSSQLSLNQTLEEELAGQSLQLVIIEVDRTNNRLIFSQKGLLQLTSEDLSNFKSGSKVKAVIKSLQPFGVVVKIDDKVKGLIAINDLSWEKVEDPKKLFKIDQEVEAAIINQDLSLGKLNLSLKQLSEDPFTKVASEYEVEDTVTGTIVSTTPQGVNVTLKDGVEGFIPASKLEDGIKYESGQKVNLLVDSIDKSRRQIVLSPLITTTKDLIYK